MVVISAPPVHCDCPTSTSACDCFSTTSTTSNFEETTYTISNGSYGTAEALFDDNSQLSYDFSPWPLEPKPRPVSDRSWTRQAGYHAPWGGITPGVSHTKYYPLLKAGRVLRLPRTRVMGRFFDHRPSRLVPRRRSSSRR